MSGSNIVLLVKKLKKVKKMAIMVVILAISIASGVYFYFELKNQKEFVAFGNIDIREVDLGFRVSGRLEKLFVDEGDSVEEGRVLAVLDKEPLQKSLNMARANYNSQKVKFENEKIKFDRYKNLIEKKAISKQQFNDEEAKYKDTAAMLEYAKSQLENEEIRLKDATLKAPSDGVISVRAFEAGSIMQAGYGVFSMLLPQYTYAKIYVPETKLAKIQLGHEVLVYADSGYSEVGKVIYISPTAEFTPKTVETKELRTNLVYRVHALFPNKEHRLHKGMPVTVKIHYDA